MTTHPHSVSTSEQRSQAVPAKPLPRWLFPALIGIPLVGALLVFGVISPTILLYVGLIGGCALMHVFGHGGHGAGGHASHEAGDQAADSTTSTGTDLSIRSSRSQAPDAGSKSGLDDRAPDDSTTDETHRHDQHSSHNCH